MNTDGSDLWSNMLPLDDGGYKIINAFDFQSLFEYNKDARVREIFIYNHLFLVMTGADIIQITHSLTYSLIYLF